MRRGKGKRRSVGRAGGTRTALPNNAPACGPQAAMQAARLQIGAARPAGNPFFWLRPCRIKRGPPRAWRRAGVPQATAWAMLACTRGAGQGNGSRQVMGRRRATPGQAVGPLCRPLQVLHCMPRLGSRAAGAQPPRAGGKRQCMVPTAPHLGGEGSGHGGVQSPAS